ncbi:MAG: hypothetical protein DMF06_08665 [Verrucomicrobia bacterium]|nr:MAG: hypothetical protein DMF06_08665 [Verrucomicrobiota bacterium]
MNATKPKPDQILVGIGVLTWMPHERRSDQYGSVFLMEDGTEAQAEMFFPKGKGRLVAHVIEPRKSEHIGDIMRGLYPVMPNVGDRLVLGEGEAFEDNCQGRKSLGVSPGNRANDWLDPRALYNCHESLVQLIWETI